jgi:hypothetical protein
MTLCMLVGCSREGDMGHNAQGQIQMMTMRLDSVKARGIDY